MQHTGESDPLPHAQQPTTPTLLSPDYFKLLPPASFQTGPRAGEAEHTTTCVMDDSRTPTVREGLAGIQYCPVESQEEDLELMVEESVLHSPGINLGETPAMGLAKASTSKTNTTILDSVQAPAPSSQKQKSRENFGNEAHGKSVNIVQQLRGLASGEEMYSLNDLDDDDDNVAQKKPLQYSQKPHPVFETPQDSMDESYREQRGQRKKRDREYSGDRKGKRRSVLDGHTENDAVLAQLLQDDEYRVANSQRGRGVVIVASYPQTQHPGAMGNPQTQQLEEQDLGAVGGNDYHPVLQLGREETRMQEQSDAEFALRLQCNVSGWSRESDRKKMEEQMDAKLAVELPKKGREVDGGSWNNEHAHHSGLEQSDRRRIQEQKDAQLALSLQHDGGRVVYMCEVGRNSCLHCGGLMRDHRGGPAQAQQQMDMSYESLLELEDVSHGVDRATLSNLTSTHSHQASRGASKETRSCAVCLTDYTPGEQLRSLPCFHTFHAECVEKWLLTSSNCPVCMKDIKEH